jgi:hypothetical protein
MPTYANTPPREKPSLSRRKLKMFASRGLVRISATYSAVGKYLRMACFIDTTSWTKQTLRSMCFARRELPELHLMAAVLSSKITVGSLYWYLRSHSTPRSHITYWAQLEEATYSASAVDEATQPCFLLVQCTRSSPKYCISPDVDFHSTSPPQLASEYEMSVDSPVPLSK